MLDLFMRIFECAYVYVHTIIYIFTDIMISCTAVIFPTAFLFKIHAPHDRKDISNVLYDSLVSNRMYAYM